MKHENIKLHEIMIIDLGLSTKTFTENENFSLI